MAFDGSSNIREMFCDILIVTSERKKVVCRIVLLCYANVGRRRRSKSRNNKSQDKWPFSIRFLSKIFSLLLRIHTAERINIVSDVEHY